MTSLKDDVERIWSRLRGDSSHLEKTDKHFWALKDVSFEVQEGEVLGIIGKNGAGKSTLLKLLSRITEPTFGHAIMRGRVASLLEVGTGFHPDLTGRENIYLNGATLGMTRAEIKRKFDEIVAFSGVEQFIDTPVKRYSSGMTVRLGFAVAAHLEPEILIVDEVLAVGDAEFQDKCIGKMRDVASGGRTVLFVSHNMTSIERLCTKGIVMRNGKVDFNGSQNDCIDFYLHNEDFNQLKDLGNDDVKIENLLINGSKYNNESNKIRFNETLELEFTITPRKSYRSCALVVQLFSNKLELISNCNTPEEGVGLFNLTEGESIRFKLRTTNVDIYPGTYFVGFNLLQHGAPESILKSNDALRFSIIENLIEGGTSAYSGKHGITRFFESMELGISGSHIDNEQ